MDRVVSPRPFRYSDERQGRMVQTPFGVGCMGNHSSVPFVSPTRPPWCRWNERQAVWLSSACAYHREECATRRVPEHRCTVGPCDTRSCNGIMGLNKPSMWYFSGDVTRGQSLPRLSSYRPKTQLNFRSHNSFVALFCPPEKIKGD